MGRDSHDPFCRNRVNRSLLSGFLFFFDLNHFASIVEAAFRANSVRKAHGTAIGAGNGIYRGQRILRATAVTASLGMFALWMWGHWYFLLLHTSDGLYVPVCLVTNFKRTDYIGRMRKRQAKMKEKWMCKQGNRAQASSPFSCLRFHLSPCILATWKSKSLSPRSISMLSLKAGIRSKWWNAPLADFQ